MIPGVGKVPIFVKHEPKNVHVWIIVKSDGLCIINGGGRKLTSELESPAKKCQQVIREIYKKYLLYPVSKKG